MNRRTIFPLTTWSSLVPVLLLSASLAFHQPDHCVWSEELKPADEGPSTESVRKAIKSSLPLLEAGAKGAFEQRKQCFTCHNQGLPILAMTVARSKGFAVDEQLLESQLQFTADFLKRNKSNYQAGKGQGGQIDTAGYALWTLDNGGRKPDEVTTAVAEYLLLFQKDADHYQPQSRRPPSEQSHFTSSYVALRGLKTYATPEQKERVESRISQVRKWLIDTRPEDHEDRVFRLRALHLASATDKEIGDAANDLLTTQHQDGGWSQLPDLESDAYATGTALVALHQTSQLSSESPQYRKGLAYLISQQKADGSWHVTSRSKPFQTYFESGYPHGKDQFISIAAAGWSTTALALSLPTSSKEPDQRGGMN